MPDRPAALVICGGNPASDPRPQRMIDWLAPHFSVTAICGRGGNAGEHDCLTLPQPTGSHLARKIRGAIQLKFRRYQGRIWSKGMAELADQARSLRPHFIVVHDLALLPLALAVRGPRGSGARVLFDAREYYTRHFEDDWFWRFMFQRYNEHLAHRYLAEADVIVTVCPGLAAEYEREFGIRCGVLPGYPEPHALIPSPVASDRVRMVHHGFAARNRRIELMIDLMAQLPSRFELDLMLVGSNTPYGRALRKRAASNRRIRFRDPVAFSKIIPEINAYDVGLYLLPQTGFNTRHSLPNKFFEFIHARLAVAIGPSVEMAPYVRRFGCGLVSDDFAPSSLALLLAETPANRFFEMKNASHRAAAELTSDLVRNHVLDCAINGAGVEVFRV